MTEFPLESRTADNGGTQTVERALRLLVALGKTDRVVTPRELSATTGLPLSTTYRLLTALERVGLVDSSAPGGVSIGVRTLELALNADRRVNAALVEPASPTMRQLAERFHENVLLTAPAGTEAIAVAVVESPRPVFLSYGHRRSVPMHLGASGKILLAFLLPAATERVLTHIARQSHCDGPRVDLDQLRRELEAGREAGYLVTRGEIDEAITAIAAPILNRRGRIVAGLSIAGPSSRLSELEAEIVPAVVEAASAIRPEA